MKRLLFITLVIFITINSFADRDSHKRAKRYGATATFKLTVVDDQGTPVEDVNGNAGFFMAVMIRMKIRIVPMKMGS